MIPWLLWLCACPGPSTTDQGSGSDTSDTTATDSSATPDSDPPQETGDTGPLPDTDTDPPPERWCNGRQDLCDRPLDRVVFPGTHNSMSNADAGWVVPNQTHGLTQQLQDGIRALLLDTHDFNGEPSLCHANCWLGSQPLVEGLGELKTFLDDQPTEVLILIIEDHVGAAETEAAFVTAGVENWTYAHPGGSWPTLAELIDAGTRIVVSAEHEGPPPDWYHHAWDVWQDTPYAFWHEDDFSCELNRGAADNPLFLVNHWLGNPVANSWTAEIANSAAILEARVADCEAVRGRLPGVIAVDFYELGDLFVVVDALNDRGGDQDD